MTYYKDINLCPNSEINIAFLRNKTYERLHRALVDLKSTTIGISFPNMRGKEEERLLGNIIRIHSKKDTLEKLQKLNWINSLVDYCQIGDMLPIPSKIKGHQNISRVRQTMNEAKLKKQVVRAKEKGDKTQDEIEAYIKQYKAKMFATSLNNPYLELQSMSTKSRYRIYLKFSEIQEKESKGEFNQFCLSQSATIPIF